MQRDPKAAPRPGLSCSISRRDRELPAVDRRTGGYAPLGGGLSLTAMRLWMMSGPVHSVEEWPVAM